MMKKSLLLFIIIILVSIPVISLAQTSGLVPCDDNCGFLDLMKLLNNIISFIFKFLALPLAALMFAYAGFVLVTSGGSSEARGQAKNIFLDAVIGLVLAAAAWLIVKTLLSIMGYKDINMFF